MGGEKLGGGVDVDCLVGRMKTNLYLVCVIHKKHTMEEVKRLLNSVGKNSMYSLSFHNKHASVYLISKDK